MMIQALLLLLVTGAQAKSVYETVSSDSDFEMLTDAIERADMVDFYSNEDPITFFAPDDHAFEAFLYDSGVGEMSNLSQDEWKRILQYHTILNVAASSSQLSDGQVITTASGDSIIVLIEDNGTINIGDKTNRPGGVTEPNVMADNGIIHVINKVLISNPTQPTYKPTERPTEKPTEYPTKEPTYKPTKEPTKKPTKKPTKYPTQYPTAYPTEYPTTKKPTKYPTTKKPTKYPTKYPTAYPTDEPTYEPTEHPTKEPTKYPTEYPTEYPTTKAKSVYDVVSSDPDFEMLTDAIERADMVDFYSNEDPITFFAPDDHAFEAFLYDSGVGEMSNLSQDEWKRILQYHTILNVAASSSQISDGQVITTASGDSIIVLIEDNGTINIGDKTNRPGGVTEPDVMAKNGIIHVINKVLISNPN